MELSLIEDGHAASAQGDIQITPLIDADDPTATPYYVVMIDAPGRLLVRLQMTRLEMMGLWAEAGNAVGWGPPEPPPQAEP